MADNSTLPATGDVVAADEIGGVKFQRMKLIHGADGANDGDVSLVNPYPVQATRTDDLVAMMQRMIKLMETLAVVDQQQRQRISLDSIPAGVTLPTVTTVTTVTAVSNVTATAGMDREQYINTAKQTYAASIRSQLTFV